MKLAIDSGEELTRWRRALALGRWRPPVSALEVALRGEGREQGLDAGALEPEPVRDRGGRGRLVGQRVEDSQARRGDHRPGAGHRDEGVLEGIRLRRGAHRVSLGRQSRDA
jgi:hypothetical protein